MTLLEMKKKVLRLIEEIDDTKEDLTSDPDIREKLNDVINQVQFELCRMKKILATDTAEVESGEVFDMNTLPDFYQLRKLRFVNEEDEEADCEIIEHMVVFPENGTATFFYYKFPERITDETADTYEFELSEDCLEILPYGVAADLLKSDVSTQYGAIYEKRYETMLQRLDPRYGTETIFIEGGLDI